MREIRSYGSVGEPVGNHRLYPEGLAKADHLLPSSKSNIRLEFSNQSLAILAA